MTAAHEGFSFGFESSNSNISIDFDSFFQILNESSPLSDPNFSADAFFPSSDNIQECGSTAQLGNHQDFLLHRDYVSENNAPKTEVLEQLPSTSPAEIVLADANHPSASSSSIESHMFQLPNFMETNYSPSTQDNFNKLNFCADVPDQNLLDCLNYDFMLTNGQIVSDNKDHGDDFWPCYSRPENKRALDAQVEGTNMSSSQAPMYDFFDGIGRESMLNGSHLVSTYDSCSSTTTDEASAERYMWGLMGQPCENHIADMKDERNNETLEGFECMLSSADKGIPLEPVSSVMTGPSSGNSLEVHYSVGERGDSFVQHRIPGVVKKPTDLQQLEKPVSSVMTGPLSGNSCFKKKGANKMVQLVSVKSDPFKSTPKVITLSEHGNGGGDDDDDDDDICIIENMSQPGGVNSPVTQKKSRFTPQRITFTPKSAAVVPSPPSINVGGTRQKATGERQIFQALVQGLSQPKSEATPPDGVLAVPLLRHQRIALSWMVQKETTGLQCFGGILADDQGLGKTVSTIALILMERPPSRALKEKALKLETLDLDADADKSANQRTNGTLENGVEASPSKGRPSGGTLIVCPTSVLRQWAEELRTKVTSKAGLSVLVYHGSNRSKDPNEVAKFDVVLTTYSIVSMEVPGQSVNDKRNLDADDEPITLNRKRKHSSSSDKNQGKKGMEKELLESIARPLARMRWFRVVLDEAQSIKNFKTQVAQACWGLRAKRRWCLSGTPIQNAVDDLYSYFRFLKYDPYSVYNSFCSMVKNPISRNPSSGYRKLQAVLKTIMLRRTKGTRLDGKPIISLPPKSVKVMKVEFSEEERDFYSKLEADSRAQFEAYAESGTVKQNYVNILLLLLRLRQACDHPLLVKGCASSSVVKSSIHMAKKLPQEQQIGLLNCLEISLAICHICTDPPEDAVVSICGHVFCNQCISERLSGDDYQCLARNCKTQLSMSSIFSKATLKSCLSEGSCQGGTHICPASEFSDQKESIETAPFGYFDSSKLKAALEVLQSLSKPQVSASVNVCMESVDSNSSLLVESNTTSALDIKGSDTSNGLGISNAVVKEKAIVFSQWTRMLDMLESCLKESSIEYRRLDGTMSVVARDKAVKDFNTRPEVTVMIMSLKAASLGLNMVAACHVLLLDLWWNPTTEDQAIDRAHRIGQTRPVTVLRLTVKDTVEDRILALQQRKRRLVASAFGEDKSGSRQTRLTVDDLKYLFMA